MKLVLAPDLSSALLTQLPLLANEVVTPCLNFVIKVT
jgi:hypothetical protein